LNEPPETFLYRAIYLDAVQLVRVLMKMDGVDPYGSVSWEVRREELYPSLPQPWNQDPEMRPLYPFLCDFQRVWELDLGEQPYEELRNWFRRFDPTHSREQEIFTRLGYLDVQFLAPGFGEKSDGNRFNGSDMPSVYPVCSLPQDQCTKTDDSTPDFGHESIPGFSDEFFSL
jgi:cephalosporin-C deacetylase